MSDNRSRQPLSPNKQESKYEAENTGTYGVVKSLDRVSESKKEAPKKGQKKPEPKPEEKKAEKPKQEKAKEEKSGQ